MGAKTIEELESTACKYWPPELAQKVRRASPINLLIDTQDKFLSILKCADTSPEAWIDVLSRSKLGANQFVKHLTVLTDIGGERLQRFGRDLRQLFPSDGFTYSWNGKSYRYVFKSVGTGWTNPNLLIDKDNLFEERPMQEAMIDVCMLLMWGADITDSSALPQEIIDKCIVGRMIGNPKELEAFVRQRYIYVSRITGGSTANDGGHFCEASCCERLRRLLPKKFEIEGHNIKGISQNKRNLVTFDMVVTNVDTNKSCAIEISFQVTTNSVIERKASAARERQKLLHKHGHKMTYIIDGAGNFQRKNAVRTIMDFSDCTVNFSDDGINTLAAFIRESL